MVLHDIDQLTISVRSFRSVSFSALMITYRRYSSIRAGWNCICLSSSMVSRPTIEMSASSLAPGWRSSSDCKQWSNNCRPSMGICRNCAVIQSMAGSSHFRSVEMLSFGFWRCGGAVSSALSPLSIISMRGAKTRLSL